MRVALSVLGVCVCVTIATVPGNVLRVLFNVSITDS